mmetsp:Transcript_14089/g.26833  ORF Transcript_14089/g.26833 Transcript_14089/m.26833 type:complete len:118 (+) Transcript_14089:207-560(+)
MLHDSLWSEVIEIWSQQDREVCRDRGHEDWDCHSLQPLQPLLCVRKTVIDQKLNGEPSVQHFLRCPVEKDIRYSLLIVVPINAWDLSTAQGATYCITDCLSADRLKQFFCIVFQQHT